MKGKLIEFVSYQNIPLNLRETKRDISKKRHKKERSTKDSFTFSILRDKGNKQKSRTLHLPSLWKRPPSLFETIRGRGE